MTSQEKKRALDESNATLNKLLDGEPIPPAVIEFAKKTIAENDRWGWFIAADTKPCIVHCAACQTAYALDHKPKHLSHGICKNCGREIELRKQGRSHNFGKNMVQNICFYENRGDVVVARVFRNERIYSDTRYSFDVNKDLYEFQRVFYRQSGVRRFNTRCWGMTSDDWSSIDTLYRGDNYEVFQTKENLRAVLARTYLQNTPWVDYDGVNMFALYKFGMYPALEYILKLGYKRLVREIIYDRAAEDKTINLRERKLNTVMGVPHSILQKYNHESLKECDIKAIKQIIAFGRLGQLTVERFQFIQSVLTRNSLDPLDVFRNFGLEKVFNYIEKQRGLKQVDEPADACGCSMEYWGMKPELNARDVWHDFQDYRRECHYLGYNITDEGVMFPRDMYAAHERTSLLAMEKRRIERTNEEKKYYKERLEKFGVAIEKYKDKQFKDGDLIIRVARTPDELTYEGEKLNHCVGDYVGRIIGKQCLIFFIRSTAKPDKPLYTLEIGYNNKAIIQCRGRGNINAPAEVFDFVKTAFASGVKWAVGNE